VQNRVSQHPADEPQDVWVSDSFLDQFHEHVVVHRVKEFLDVHLYGYAVVGPFGDHFIKARERLVGVLPGPKTVAMSMEGRLIDGFQDFSHQELDDFIFPASNGEWSMTSLGLRDEFLAGGLGSPSAAINFVRELREVFFQILAVLFFRDLVDSDSLISVDLPECLPEVTRREVMQEVPESLLAVALGS
jgi:hypothetical protein